MVHCPSDLNTSEKKMRASLIICAMMHGHSLRLFEKPKKGVMGYYDDLPIYVTKDLVEDGSLS